MATALGFATRPLLTLSPPIPLRLDHIRALWRSGLSARAPECQKIKNGGLDQYGAEPSEQQLVEAAGVGGVKCLRSVEFIALRTSLRRHLTGGATAR